jgi:hypothetical protein
MRSRRQGQRIHQAEDQGQIQTEQSYALLFGFGKSQGGGADADVLHHGHDRPALRTRNLELRRAVVGVLKVGRQPDITDGSKKLKPSDPAWRL